jgi:hypothetical protein
LKIKVVGALVTNAVCDLTVIIVSVLMERVH